MNRQKNDIATHEEVLEFFSDVMRRSGEENVKISDAMSAADKLHKYYLQLGSDDDTNDAKTGIVILPEVKTQ